MAKVAYDLEQIKARLTALATRREQEGSYTDRNVCEQAKCKLLLSDRVHSDAFIARNAKGYPTFFDGPALFDDNGEDA